MLYYRDFFIALLYFTPICRHSYAAMIDTSGNCAEDIEETVPTHNIVLISRKDFLAFLDFYAA